jgi:hypothetical protein
MGPVAVDSTAMVRLAVDDTNKGQAVDIETGFRLVARITFGEDCKIQIWPGW